MVMSFLKFSCLREGGKPISAKALYFLGVSG